MTTMIARCACGAVEIEASGAPIASAVCSCDTCDEGSPSSEAFPNAAPVREPDGGTSYVLYRTDRIRYSKGAHRIGEFKLDEKSRTVRAFAGCCRSAMIMRFDDARHEVSRYRGRLRGRVPPLQFRICTKFRTDDRKLSGATVNASMYPPGPITRLLSAKIAMLLRPRR